MCIIYCCFCNWCATLSLCQRISQKSLESPMMSLHWILAAETYRRSQPEFSITYENVTPWIFLEMTLTLLSEDVLTDYLTLNISRSATTIWAEFRRIFSTIFTNVDQSSSSTTEYSNLILKSGTTWIIWKPLIWITICWEGVFQMMHSNILDPVKHSNFPRIWFLPLNH